MQLPDFLPIELFCRTIIGGFRSEISRCISLQQLLHQDEENLLSFRGWEMIWVVMGKGSLGKSFML